MSNFYKIAGLTVEMNTTGKTLSQAEAYRCDPAPADIVIQSDIAFAKERQPHLSLDDCEYMSTGADFYTKLLKYNGLLVHSSAVVMDGYAYLFSAPCGTGKSTHTSLWQKVFGSDRAQILNDDKPAIRLEDGVWYAYGTPWSGKTTLNLNLRAPLAGICFLRRGETNTIKPFGGFQAICALVEQTARPSMRQCRSQIMRLVDSVFQNVPIWEMHCNMELDAPQVSYAAMSAAIKNKKENEQ